MKKIMFIVAHYTSSYSDIPITDMNVTLSEMPFFILFISPLEIIRDIRVRYKNLRIRDIGHGHMGLSKNVVCLNPMVNELGSKKLEHN